MGTLATLLPGGGAGRIDELFFFLFTFLEEPTGFSNLEDPVDSKDARNADDDAGVDADLAASCVNGADSITTDLIVPRGRMRLDPETS